MEASPIEVALGDEAATQRLGEDLAMAVRPGDVLALQGDLGAGKSTLARALIRALADDTTLEVPSPTFTLVQSYETRFPVHHRVRGRAGRTRLRGRLCRRRGSGGMARPRRQPPAGKCADGRTHP
jgi:ABC-type microcin C transport system duplicated ATPase subunit YejF